MTDEEKAREFIENGIVQSTSTTDIKSFVRLLVSLKFEEEKQIFLKSIDEANEKYRLSMQMQLENKVTMERHALLVEEYMQKMNEILEKRL